MVIKKTLVEKHPWIVLNLLKAFDRANVIAERQRLEHVEYHLLTGLIPPECRDPLSQTLVMHGVRANRRELETM